jgi:hypothetical protein
MRLRDVIQVVTSIEIPLPAAWDSSGEQESDHDLEDSGDPPLAA